MTSAPKSVAKTATLGLGLLIGALVCGPALADAPPRAADQFGEGGPAEPTARADVARDKDQPMAKPWSLPALPYVHPTVFDAHTAHILAGAAVQSTSGIDTAGSLTTSTAVGLGDVADFGVNVTDLIRARPGADREADILAPYVSATLRIGTAEREFFAAQPALALGFRKSFQREIDGFDTRVAELFLIASKSLGDSVELHVGASLWDAELSDPNGGGAAYLHENGLGKQIRGSFGIAVDATPTAQLMLETFWVPEFLYDERRVSLQQRFAFGVRFAAADWVAIESGVSVPDLGDRDLLGAQIFTRIRLTSHRFARAYQEVK